MNSKTPNLRPVSLAIAIAAGLLTQPVFGGAVNLVNLTENSSSSLSATYNGSAIGITVLNTSSDHWTITFPITITFFNLDVGWIEPENPGQVNLIGTTNPASNQLLVISDTTPNLTTVFQDGAISTIPIGLDTSNPFSIPVFASFRDLAAAGETRVPDTGTTGSLFGLSLMGLAFLRQKP